MEARGSKRSLEAATALAVIAAFALTAGCGSSEQGGPRGALARAIATEVCASYERCGGASYTTSMFGTGRACVDAYSLGLEEGPLAELAAATEAGRTTYDAAAAAECAAAIRAAGCARDADPFTVAVWDACEDVYVGLVPDGGACEHDEVCGAASYCQRSGVGSCGACAPRLAAGSACMYSSSCGGGLACVGGVCIAMSDALGASCGGPSAGDSCGRLDLYCMAPAGAGTGTCVRWEDLAVRVLGDPCDGTTGARCADGLACAVDLVTGAARCVAPVGAGEACTWAYPEMCPSGYLCDVVGAALVCAPLPGPGERCGGNTNDRCAPGARCAPATMTCVASVRLGDPCVEPWDCASGSCAAGLCAVPMTCGG